MDNTRKPFRFVVGLVNAFGADAVKVCNQYHVQVVTGGGRHDVYRTKEGHLKLSLAGHARAVPMGIERIIEALTNYQKQGSDLAQMKKALDVAKLMATAAQVQRQVSGPIVYVDAGWKDGRGRLGVVHVIPVPDGDPTIHAMAKSVIAANSSEAERLAVIEGLGLAPDVPVLTDCKAVADQMADNPRVRWISRTANKAADAIGNCRKKG